MRFIFSLLNYFNFYLVGEKFIYSNIFISFEKRKILITIIVGSTNPAKVNAVKMAADTYWNKYELISMNVDTGIPNMPIGKEITRQGAKNRAINSLNIGREKKINGTILGVGNEAGAALIDGDWYLFVSSYVTDGQINSWGSDVLFRLPQIFTRDFDKGRELGETSDDILETNNIKQGKGTIAYLTDQKVERADLVNFSVKVALSPWVNSFKY